MTSRPDTVSTPRSGLHFLRLVVFTSGMTTLAVELSASRLLGTVFGTSNLVWANVIGLMLLYLTVGYFLGGRWADRSPYAATLYRILLWASFLCAIVPLVSRPILQVAAGAFAGIEAALALGSFAAVLVLFSVPITLLGTTSPFAIRLAVQDVQSAGRISGQMYAISTVGSILGTFLPTLLLIPELGTTRTFLLFSGVLFFVAFVGLWRETGKRALRYLWMPLLAGIGAAIVLGGPLRPPPEGERLLFEAESAYNYIQVTENGSGYRFLYLNEGQGIHSQYHPSQIMFGRTWDFFLIGPYFYEEFSPADFESVLVIGMAAGTIARQHAAVYGPSLQVDGIEIDPEILRAGEEFFEMNTDAIPGLRTFAEDGRYALNQLDKRYTVIGIDAYRPPYIPWHLTTVEFFREVRDRLNDPGALIINVGRTNQDRRLVDALSNTLSYVFPSVHALDVPRSFNTILVATVSPTNAASLAGHISNGKLSSPFLRETLALAAEHLVPTQYGETLFIDDQAPVETLVDSLVLSFLLSGDTDILR